MCFVGTQELWDWAEQKHRSTLKAIIFSRTTNKFSQGSSDMIEHHNQKQLGKESVYFTFQFDNIVNH